MKNKWKKDLLTLIGSAKGPKELDKLLSALLAPAEYYELVKRWQIITRLIKNGTQREIRDELEVSIATVTRGSRELKYGNGIFQKFYKRIQTKQAK